ncbi:FUSC family protein [Enterobacter sp. Cy-643]|uniref:FUSC family protein n=1 Tax=Enterobacter sp. Cy-643 TaxID=2608346 RepID=UPI00141F7CE5|nr:FUSC family protein [Enterobacter sp. Cy-643]NIF30846.1 FUSC family protein [Enterobacter sp. Cy-643]
MNKINAGHLAPLWGKRVTPALLNDAHALLYAAKSFAAAMLAYYLALSIGLGTPSWAIVTVYIVSQTTVGSSLSKGVYRLAGTVVGAAATVLIVTTFVNMPILCSVVLTGWITLCLYFSLLERTPRAYAFVLAGYTASLIGFPALHDPGSIFDTAITRVQEISLGILCASLVHRYVLPKRIAGLFNAKFSETLHSARQAVAASLSDGPSSGAKHLHMALPLQLLQTLNHHVPFDFALSVPVREARKKLHDKLTRLLVVNSELSERRQMINALDPRLLRLENEVRSWLNDEPEITGEALDKQSSALAKMLAAAALQPEDVLQASLAAYLCEAITLLLQCEKLYQTIAQSPQPLENEPAAKGYVLHRDGLSAARTALGAFTLVLAGCLAWIYSAWPDGATAVSVIGVCCTLFGSFDTPAPHLIKYAIGSLYGVAISLLYSFAILPQITTFSVLAAALAPVYLLAGSLQANPPTTFMAMGITLTLPILSGLGPHYGGDFAVALNTATALFIAIGFAVFGMGLLQTVQADAAIDRLLQLCHRDVKLSAKGAFTPDEVVWTNLMIDRTALLLPRLQRSEQSAEQILNQMLHYLRTGLATLHLRQLQVHLNRETAAQIHELLGLLACETDLRKIQATVFALINAHSPAANALTRRLNRGLIDLYCALNISGKESADDR